MYCHQGAVAITRLGGGVSGHRCFCESVEGIAVSKLCLRNYALHGDKSLVRVQVIET